MLYSVIVLTVLASAYSYLKLRVLVIPCSNDTCQCLKLMVVIVQVVNFARNYTRLVLAWAPEGKQREARAALRWAMAAPHVLRGYIRQMKAESYKVGFMNLLAIFKWLHMLHDIME